MSQDTGRGPLGGGAGGFKRQCIAMHQSHCSATALQLQPLPLSGIRGRPSSPNPPNTILVLPIRNFGCLILEVFQKPQKFSAAPVHPMHPIQFLFCCFILEVLAATPKAILKSPKSFSKALKVFLLLQFFMHPILFSPKSCQIKLNLKTSISSSPQKITVRGTMVRSNQGWAGRKSA